MILPKSAAFWWYGVNRVTLRVAEDFRLNPSFLDFPFVTDRKTLYALGVRAWGARSNEIFKVQTGTWQSALGGFSGGRGAV